MSEQPFDARSPGEMLRTARERQGLHIATLAAAIKVAPRKLDALEHDRWDELPDATFVRALAQTVCRTLKIDPAPVLALMPPAGNRALEPARSSLNAPFQDRPGRDEPGLSLGAIRPMVVAASLLMVAALALFLVPDRYWSGAWLSRATAPASSSAGAASAATAALLAGSAPAASAPVAESMASGATGLFPPADAVPVLAAVPAAMTPPAAAGGAAIPPAAAPAAAIPPPAAPAAVPAAAPMLVASAATKSIASGQPAASAERAASGAGVLRVRTTGVSWIEARDGASRVLLSRLVQAGEQLDLNGSAPIRLTIGNAAATRLDFRGQPVDLLPSTRDNVARVELK
jgi:cytoskeleton protein RodZ